MADAHVNFAYTTVTVAPSPSASGTSMTVADGSVLPATPFNATVWVSGANPLNSNAEIVRVTSRVGNDLTIQRAQEGTAARAIVSGDQFAASITAKTLTDAELTISDGTNTQGSGTVRFSNANGVSFGLNAGTLTASHNGLTTAAQSNHSHGNPTLNLTNLSGTTASNSAGLTLSLSAHPSQTVQPGIQSVSAGTTRVTTGEVVWSNSNGVSFGANGQMITASHNGLTTARASNDAVGLNTALTEGPLAWTVNSAGISLNAGSAAGTTSGFAGNLIGGSMTHNTAGLNLSLSHPDWLTTAAASNHSHGNPTLELTNISGTTASNSAGLTLSLSAAAPGAAGFSAGVSNLGNTGGDTGVTGTRLVFVGSQNITLNQATDANGATVSISGGAGAAGNTGFISAGAATASLGTVIFSNSNGVSFGVNGQTVTASHNGLTVQSAQSAIRGLGVSNTGQTAGNTGLSTGIDWVLAGSQSLTLSQSTAGGGPNTIWFQHPAWLTTAMQSNAVTLSNIRVSAGTTSNLLSALTLNDGNGISFGMNASTLTASHNGLTSQSNQNVTAGNGGFAFQTLSFSNLNGISFGTSAGSAITASHNALTTARASNDGVGLNTAQTNVTWTVNSAGISLNAGAYLTTAMQSNAVTLSNINISAGTTSTNASAFTFNNANGISFGLGTGASVGSITASHNGLTSQSNQAFSADASSTFQTLTFQDSNGISFSNNAGALRVTHALQFTSATSAITSNALHSSASRVINIVAATNNTGGGTASLSSNVSFSNANGATFYTSAGGAVVLSYTVPAGGGAAISGGANSQNTGTVNFANSNGITFGLSNNGTMTASHNGLTTARASNDAVGLNTALTAGPLAWTVNSAGISLNAGSAAGTTSGFTGANISVSMTHNTAGLALSASVAAPGAAAEANAIALLGANTAGNTTATGSTIGWSGLNLTLSGTNASQVVISAPATSSLSATGLVSLSTNGSTISIGVPGTTFQRWFPHRGVVYAAGQVGQNSIHVQPAEQLDPVTFDRLGCAVLFSGATNSTMTVNCTVRMGVYTKNVSTLSQLTSFSGSFSINGSGTQNSTVNSGPRWATMTLNGGSISGGDLWIAIQSSTATVGVNATLSNWLASRLNSTWSGIIGVASAASAQAYPGMGFYSATSNAMPSSMAFSHITGNSSAAQRPPVFFVTNGALPF